MTGARSTTVANLEAATPLERVERLIGLTGNLTRVIEQESDYLKNQEPALIETLLEEKLRLSSDYAFDINLLSQSPHVLDQAPAAAVSRLKTNMSTLKERLEDNERLLGTLKDASEEFVKAVASIAARHRQPASAYGKSGAMEAPAKTTPAALALDQQI